MSAHCKKKKLRKYIGVTYKHGTTIFNIFISRSEVNVLFVIVSPFSSFGGGEEQEAQDETINVFSVASGHLYERFLRIMMLSVLKHTKSPVKFWFLKNYLSPSLKVSTNVDQN